MRPKNPIGEPFVELSEVDNTNNYAMRQVQTQMAVHGSTWFAWYQNAGKGQRGKQWKAGHGSSLMMSSVVEPDYPGIENQFLLNQGVALACYDLVNSQVKSKISIKWPNDIYWNDRKAGGILIENVILGSAWKFSIIGIGININQTCFPHDLPNAISLQQITGKTYDVISLAKQLCNNLEYRWNQLCSGKSADLTSDYAARLYKAGEKVKFKKNNGVFEAKVIGVNNNGELILQTGQQLINISGSIEWLP